MPKRHGAPGPASPQTMHGGVAVAATWRFVTFPALGHATRHPPFKSRDPESNPNLGLFRHLFLVCHIVALNRGRGILAEATKPRRYEGREFPPTGDSGAEAAPALVIHTFGLIAEKRQHDRSIRV